MSTNYDAVADKYYQYRKPDPRIASLILKHLGDAKRVLNVGAGIGSYEPTDRDVVAVEPFENMIALRSESAAPAHQGVAEDLPFGENEFDAAMAILTIHHWTDINRGLSEMKRVANGKVVLMTWMDPESHFWLEDYIPQLREADYSLFPDEAQLEVMLGPITVEPVLMPHDCTDGVYAAYWRRPEAYLDADIRDSISAFGRLDESDLQAGLAKLEADFSSGAWSTKYAHLTDLESLDVGYRIVASA